MIHSHVDAWAIILCGESRSTLMAHDKQKVKPIWTRLERKKWKILQVDETNVCKKKTVALLLNLYKEIGVIELKICSSTTGRASDNDHSCSPTTRLRISWNETKCGWSLTTHLTDDDGRKVNICQNTVGCLLFRGETWVRYCRIPKWQVQLDNML